MKVASFNIRKLGFSKVSDRTVLPYLVKIVSRYSVVLILEVVDKSGKAMAKLLKELNSTRGNKQHPYSMVKSARLGRDVYKEQFVFLYREDQVTLTDTYQYEDNQVGDEDVFAREPYILHFTCLNTVLKDLVLIPVHTKPEDSEKELDELYDVFLNVKKKWRTENVMILGDFNADGRYVTKTEMKGLRIRSDKNFHWLIGDDVDTTASTGNDYTYDRIVVYGQHMLEAIVPDSAQPFNFHTAFRLSTDLALSISDHYPVEVELRSAARPQKKRACPRAAAPQKKRACPRAARPQKKRACPRAVGPQKKRACPRAAGPQKKRACPRAAGPQKKRGPPRMAQTAVKKKRQRK